MRFFNLPTYSSTPDGAESIPSSDSNQTDRRFTLSGLAKWVVESYADSTLAGAVRTIKNAIDTIDSVQWTTATSLADTYKAAIITAANARRLITIGNIAKYIVESYSDSSLAGSSQSVKSAVNSLNDKWLYETRKDSNLTLVVPANGDLRYTANSFAKTGYTLVSLYVSSFSGSTGASFITITPREDGYTMLHSGRSGDTEITSITFKMIYMKNS